MIGGKERVESSACEVAHDFDGTLEAGSFIQNAKGSLYNRSSHAN